MIPAYDEIQGGTSVLYNIQVSDVNIMEGFTLVLNYNTSDFTNVFVEPGDFLSSDPNDLQFITDYSTPGAIYISCTLLNGQSGASGNGTLVLINMNTQNINNITGSAITLTNVVLRNIYNQTIPASVNNALIVIDSDSPTFNNNNPLTLGEYSWYNTAPVISGSEFVFQDNFNLHSVDYTTDTNPWQEISSGIDGTLFPEVSQDWTLPNFFTLTEGMHTITWKADDDVDLLGVWDWSFNKDTEPPVGILSLVFNDITTEGFTLEAGVLLDAGQGEVYYEFNESNGNAPDRARELSQNTFSLTGLLYNTPYTYRFKASDGVTNNMPEAVWSQQCNYTEWSVNFTRYTLSVPPSGATVFCDKSTETWYSDPTFTFTADGGFGDGHNVDHYRYVWNREATHTWNGNEDVWDENATTAETLQLTADEDGNDWYLHLKGYNGDNQSNGTFDFGPFMFDGSTPCAVSALSAQTSQHSNESVILTWSNPDNDVVSIHIFAKPFGTDAGGTYPLYNGSAPVQTSYQNLLTNGWSEVATLNNTLNQFIHSPASRNEWYYQIFIEDAAGNIGPSSDMVHALSYWLGDVNTPADGIVNSNDIGLLAASWGANGLEEPHIFRNVGPTVDNSRDSRPVPDEYINFEDLMIYSLNYGNTSYLQKKSHPLMNTKPMLVTLEECHLTGKKNAVLMMDDIPQNLCAIEVTLAVKNPQFIESINSGDLVMGNDFFVRETKDNIIKITYSNLSSNAMQKGVLANIDISGCPELSILTVDARDYDNATMVVDTKTVIAEMSDNLVNLRSYPNPFSETIHFELNLFTHGLLSVLIYDLHGAVVAQLYDNTLQAGQHTIAWNGYSHNGEKLPDGIYFGVVHFCGHTINTKIILQR